MPLPYSEKQLARDGHGRAIYAIGDVNLVDLLAKLELIRSEQATQHTALLAKLDVLIAAVNA
jgi:hypothetical protein